MNIKISDRWFITCDRLQYILNEVIEIDQSHPKAKAGNKTRIIQTYYTNLGTLLTHIAEYEPRAKKVEGMGDLIQAFKDTQKTLEKAVDVLRLERVSFRVHDSETNP